MLLFTYASLYTEKTIILKEKKKIYLQDNVRHTADLNLGSFAVLKLIALPTVILSSSSTRCTEEDIQCNR